MKTNNIIKGIVAVSLLLLGLASCERVDYPDRYRISKGKPTIDYIRYANKDILIDKAYMDETVCVVGQNLTSVVKILFNDQAAVLNTSFMTDKTLLVSIPKTKAQVQTNKIYFISAAADTVDVDFEVMPPAPLATGMDCEYAKPGTVAKIYGDYFIDLEYVEFQGLNARVEVDDITYDESEITLTIPATATPGMIKIKTKSGLSGSVFHYMDQRGLLFDFDGKTGLYDASNRGWHPQTVTTDETAIDGNFLQLGDGTAEMKGDGSTWDDGHFSFEYWPGMWESPVETFSQPAGRKLSDFADFSGYANMAYKFEMFIPSSNPWKGSAMQIIPSSIYTVHNGDSKGVTDVDGEALPGCNNKYIGDNSAKYPRALYTPWADGMVDTGDKWITVTIPMANILYKPDGTPSDGKIDATCFDGLCIFVCNTGGKTGEDCKPIIKIDNIRAVPIK
ncbi:MAG: hypothetical protein IK113_08140 [Bacteroidales bacterium]|nr:hypothetical protein [Bacteroidales bacterium]